VLEFQDKILLAPYNFFAPATGPEENNPYFRKLRSKGMSGYQVLRKFYIGQGLREDLQLLRKKERTDKLNDALSELGLEPEQKTKILDLLRDYPLTKTA
jgi:hypothetical protein